jgi:hypothetical protein
VSRTKVFLKLHLLLAKGGFHPPFEIPLHNEGSKKIFEWADLKKNCLLKRDKITFIRDEG